MKKIKAAEMAMIENRAEREKYMDRLEVLDKVKNLFLIPSMECMTTRQVADYYEVEYETVKKAFKRHIDEFVEDGVSKKGVADFKCLTGTSCPCQKIVRSRGSVVFSFSNGESITVPNFGINTFPKRAILRMGMLLADSRIAKEVRTQLLNAFEHTTDSTKVADINEEQELLYAIGIAYGSGNLKNILDATMALDNYRKRHITELKHDNELLVEEKGILAGKAYKWNDRASLTKLMRVFAGAASITYGKAYKLLFDELLYKHGISLRQRGSKPYTQWIKDDEYKKVYQSIAALCESMGLRTAEIFAKAKLSMD